MAESPSTKLKAHYKHFVEEWLLCVGYYKMNLSFYFVKTLKDTFIIIIVIIIIIIIIIIAVELSLGSSSPYNSTDKTNNKHT